MRGPIYELVVVADSDIRDEFGRWLTEHLERIRTRGDVVDCRLFPTAAGEPGRIGHVLQYEFAAEDGLDAFQDGDANILASELRDRFGERLQAYGRVLRPDERLDQPTRARCLNCGTLLRGQYCASCGQRSQSRLISLFELIRDAFGDMFELDSRLWQTLIPLTVRPGVLTRSYLEGKRARYMPPFRMYLVLSLIFFIVAFFDPREQFEVFFDPEDVEMTGEGENRASPEIGDEVLEELRREGIIVDSTGDEEPGGIIVDSTGNEEPGGINVRINDGELSGTFCDDIDFELEGDGWLARRLTPERVRRICEGIERDRGRLFLSNVVDNIPAALIVLLPVMAFVLMVLYPLSRRYYVEHLLFFVHFHSFFFLILTLEVVFARLTEFQAFPGSIRTLAIVAASCYVPVYLFVAMRRVYGQGRFVTFMKYIVLLAAYFAGSVAMLLGALLIAALSI